MIVVGGGGHGLATAFYLAKEHGIRNVALVERGWIGQGNVGRNTTIVRSNYLLDENQKFYEWSLKLWEGLSHTLDYNVMFSPRGVLNLANTPAQLDQYAERGNGMRLNGIDAELLDAGGHRKALPRPRPQRRRRAFRSSAACCSRAAAPRATTPSPGALRTPPTGSASTSSRTARSPAS